MKLLTSTRYPSQVEQASHTSTAVETYQLDVESTALVCPHTPIQFDSSKDQEPYKTKTSTSLTTPLKQKIRAAEDILSLTRTMKETWLFGKLDTLGEDERDVKRREDLENDALAIQKVIEGGGLLKPAK